MVSALASVIPRDGRRTGAVGLLVVAEPAALMAPDVRGNSPDVMGTLDLLFLLQAIIEAELFSYRGALPTLEPHEGTMQL